MKKYLFPIIIALSALSVSASAAFYSVYGLSKLFAGASLQVIIMAGSLEIAKLVTASLLYQYWDTINKFLKVYLTLACVILMFITSAGIYGFLSGAYQSTATKSEIAVKELAVIEMKRTRFEEKKNELKVEKTQLNTSVNDLRLSLSNPSQVQYIDRESGQLITTTSSSTRRSLKKELDITVKDRDTVAIQIEAVTDSISKLDISVLNKETNNEAERELGPLKYISELTGKPMANVINWLLMLIIFVFDPLAISLVIAANFAFNKIKPKEKKLYTKKNWIDENQTTKTNKGNVGNPKKEEMSKVEKENNKQIIKNLENKINKINQSDITEKRRNEEAIKIQKKINIIKKLKDNNNDNQITY
tara:strand:- start:2326 stop:3408 length:1083 start_codon:yes stop_codon:yes gene_type:complete